jgi:hypothetical protein
MKTTIEIKGYEIVIEETEDGVTVMAVQDGETVEEFTLEGEVSAQDDDFDAFGKEEDEEDDFEGADDYEDEMDELGQTEDELDGEESDDDDFDGESDDEDSDDFDGDMKAFGDDSEEEEEEKPMRKVQQPEEAPKMESFGDFVRRTQKGHMGRRK